jgi:hypothetical protein
MTENDCPPWKASAYTLAHSSKVCAASIPRNPGILKPIAPFAPCLIRRAAVYTPAVERDHGDCLLNFTSVSHGVVRQRIRSTLQSTVPPCRLLCIPHYRLRTA